MSVMGCVQPGKVLPVLSIHPLRHCINYRFSISFEAIYNGSRLWIDRHLLRCPISAIDRRTYTVHSTCQIGNNGGALGHVVVVSATFIIVNHRTKWEFGDGVFLDLDTHGRITLLKLFGPSCSPKVCH
jgi:hypothetical protein